MLLYALTILASAFLLFQVEPIIAKIILPWFGGSAAVWTVSLLFFQVALLLGYLYSHASVRYLKPRTQMMLHVALLAASLLTLPIYPRESWKPGPGEDPTFGILRLLTVTVGLTFFLLSTTAPLVQAWYARRFQGAVPYRLYALSNAGSMLALLSYPLLVEWWLTTRQQAYVWSAVYAGFLVLCAAAALRSAKGESQPAAAGTDEVPRPGLRHYAQWLALPACASVLLLAITNHLSQNVAAIPFLWVLPLCLYLLSFILCFESSGWYRRNPYLQLLAVALGSMAYAMDQTLDHSLPLRLPWIGQVTIPGVAMPIVLFSLGLFTCCMVCHGELAEMKPHPRYLTHYYLMISAGGALGGILVGLIAPKLLHGYYELPVGMVFCAALTVTVLKLDVSLTWFRKWWQPAPAAAVVLTLALAVYVGLQIRNSLSGVRLRVRNFYGELTVKDSGLPADLDATRSLTHGTINHGEQFLNPAKRDLPTTYYGKNTGIGIAIRSKETTGAIRVGVIGLGTGTVASYARLGDYYRYYEINPLVLGIAHTQFTFLDDCKGKVEVAMGDARLTLERESPENFDVLAVDAFSGDAIPVHLLTRQAMDLYFHHLRPNGILAVHISNRYLDLQPVLQGETAATGRVARVIDTEDDDANDVFGATWVLVTSPAAGFDADILKSSKGIESTRKVRLWTDDYSNLFQILK
jgi:SAM-dependent methyltransferase